MVNKVIVLCTVWKEDYWEKPGEAPYRKRSYMEIPEWNILSRNCPLPGLGIYTKKRGKDYTYRNFVYLRIDEMKVDEAGQPHFIFNLIKTSKSPSIKFLDKYPQGAKDYSMHWLLIRYWKHYGSWGEEPPEEWVKLVERVKPEDRWREYIGKIFLELIDSELSNEEFEDRCFELLRAIGFEVRQLGHTVTGEYPDGEISINGDIVLVYDCKNIHNYTPKIEEKRKLNEYVEDAKLMYKDREVHGIFIAKSFGRIQRSDFLLFPVNALVYLLYKRIKLGRRFNLLPIRKIVKKNYILSKTLIDNEWKT